MLLERASGILLHPTSLPNGVLDEHAYRIRRLARGSRADTGGGCSFPIVPPESRNGSPYTSPSAFASLERPPGRSPVPESRAGRDREPSASGTRTGTPGWERFAGRGSLADQVRFEREWNALRAYAAARGVRIIGDLPIYVSHGQRRQSSSIRGLFQTSRGRRRAARRHRGAGQLGATRSTTGTR